MDSTEPVAEKTSNKGWMVSKEYMDLPIGTLLYTHLVKELTDEEITEVYKKVILHDRNSWHEFARAILRKAHEK